jgi:hypothetical protein
LPPPIGRASGNLSRFINGRYPEWLAPADRDYMVLWFNVDTPGQVPHLSVALLTERGSTVMRSAAVDFVTNRTS